MMQFLRNCALLPALALPSVMLLSGIPTLLGTLDINAISTPATPAIPMVVIRLDDLLKEEEMLVGTLNAISAG